ncbi:MAG TPA: DUF4166 domain-containing protein [Galbitalea sp.]|jgi:hypothetical protein|nr:DUF4166 domain-containing protein [Galbitalea sp.]
MTDSVYQRVLGSKLAGIRPELQSYFSGHAGIGVGSGVFEVAGSRLRILHPVLAYLAWRRILFPEFGRDVPFDITNTPTPDGALEAVRTFRFPGRDRSLEDAMRVVDGNLHDFLGRRGGFEVRMSLTIADGLLHMRSTRQWLHLGPLRIPLPPIATVTVDESWADGRQHVDVRLRAPILGEWFRYAGSFTYRHEER